jgi:hypothetical protein
MEDSRDIDKLGSLEVKISEDTGRNLPQRTDNLEKLASEISQRLAKLEGADTERRIKVEEALKKI